ncbi:MAG: helix-turn-helix domain-containing protein [Bdellovibrionota bacterium]
MSKYASFSKSLHPQVIECMVQLGLKLKGARKRRRWTLANFAQRVGIARSTAQRLEKGDPSINLGAFVNAIFILGLEAEIKNLLAPERDTRGFLSVMSREPKRIRETLEEKNKLNF